MARLLHPNPNPSPNPNPNPTDIDSAQSRHDIDSAQSRTPQLGLQFSSNDCCCGQSNTTWGPYPYPLTLTLPLGAAAARGTARRPPRDQGQQGARDREGRDRAEGRPFGAAARALRRLPAD
eukprot:scaffold96142_cov39-Phaeocystis_antarctica.AAC.1